jgi:murein DD-endopeptidase MepM/ murein hydrolase activator NlpD
MPLFESPVGSDKERNEGIIWPSDWVDRNPYSFRRTYEVKRGVFAYHTGADLNLKSGEDDFAPVFAIGAGTVTYAQKWNQQGVWGGIVIINHGEVDFLEDGVMVRKPVYSRYAHVQAIAPEIHHQVGATVTKGQFIARVDGAELGFNPHLHFEISTTRILENDHGFWPGLDAALVKLNFVDPKLWLTNVVRGNVAQAAPADEDVQASTASEVRYAQFDGAQVVDGHSLSAQVVFTLKKGAELPLLKMGMDQDGFIWGEICGGPFNSHWVAVYKKDEKKLLFDTKKPV